MPRAESPMPARYVVLQTNDRGGGYVKLHLAELEKPYREPTVASTRDKAVRRVVAEALRVRRGSERHATALHAMRRFAVSMNALDRVQQAREAELLARFTSETESTGA